jgi:hypothetical protein
MICHGLRTLAFRVFVLASSVLLGAILGRAQDTAISGARTPSSGGQTAEVPSLTSLVSELQIQVQTLKSQLSELRAEEQRDREETRMLRSELEQTRGQSAIQARAQTNGIGASDPYPPYSPSLSHSPLQQTAQPPNTASQDQATTQRIGKLEEDLQLANDKINEQSQAKIESGSKYRVRLSGIVLANMFDNRGTVDNQDFPEIATQPRPLDSSGTFGGSVRQSQIGIETFGPDILGAHTSASLKFDFSGGFPNAPNGMSMGLVRLRTGTVRFDWTNTSVIAGQDQLFFSPLAPTSLASLAVPALSYSGNLWSWAPQIRVEHRVALPNHSTLLLQAGILDSLSGETPLTLYQRTPTWGERSGQPAYAGRVSWSLPVYDENLTIGAGGYYGRQYWGFGRDVDGWAGTLDLVLPLGKLIEFSGQFYRGRAVGGINGAIGQDVLLSGPLTSSNSVIRGLDSIGGWVQLKFKPAAKFEVNGAFGLDNPFANELRRFPQTPTFYGTLLSRNLSPSVNFVYQARSDVLFSVEYRRLQTSVLNGNSNEANHTTLSVGYVF